MGIRSRLDAYMPSRGELRQWDRAAVRKRKRREGLLPPLTETVIEEEREEAERRRRMERGLAPDPPKRRVPAGYVGPLQASPGGRAQQRARRAQLQAERTRKLEQALGKPCGRGHIARNKTCRSDRLDALVERLERLDARVKQAPGQMDLFAAAAPPATGGKGEGKPCGNSHISKAKECHKGGGGSTPKTAAPGAPEQGVDPRPMSSAAERARQLREQREAGQPWRPEPPAVLEKPAGAEEPPRFASPDDLDGELARRAHAGTSFDPEKRGRAHQEDYARHLNTMHEEMSLLAAGPEQKAAMEAAMADYRDGYKQRYTAWLEAKSRVMSPMISGPARFPVARMEKRNQTERKRLQELIDYQKRGKTAMVRRISGAALPETQRNQALAGLTKAIDRDVEVVKDIDAGGRWKHMDRGAFTGSIKGKIARLAAKGEVEVVEGALEHIRLAQVGMAKPLFTPRHSIWEAGEQARRHRRDMEARSSARPGADKQAAAFQSGEIERDADADRIRIRFHDGKPSESIRRALKGSGRRWSPTNSAWQRLNTLNTLASAERILRQADQERGARSDARRRESPGQLGLDLSGGAGKPCGGSHISREKECRKGGALVPARSNPPAAAGAPAPGGAPGRKKGLADTMRETMEALRAADVRQFGMLAEQLFEAGWSLERNTRYKGKSKDEAREQFKREFAEKMQRSQPSPEAEDVRRRAAEAGSVSGALKVTLEAMKGQDKRLEDLGHQVIGLRAAAAEVGPIEEGGAGSLVGGAARRRLRGGR